MYTLLLTASLLAPQAPNGDYLPQNGRSLETYPLHGLLGPHQEDNLPWPPPLGTFLKHRDCEQYYALSPCSAVDTDVLVEVLANLHREPFDDGLLQLDVQGGTLLVSGDRELTRAVGADLRQLRALLARPIALEASLYRWPRDETVTPILAPDRLRGTVADLERLWHGTTRIRSGQVAELGVESWSDYLRSVDAEVAQEASIGRPVMESVFEGIRILVQPHALSGSEDLVLFCQGAFGHKREPMRLRATGVPDLPSLDVPLLDVNAGTFSGRIRSGGALAVTSTGHGAAGSRLLLVVSAHYDAPPADLGSADLRLFPVSALTGASLQSRRGLPHHYPPLLEQEEWYEEDDDERGYGSVDLDVLMELIRATRPEEFDAEGTALFQCGTYLVVRGMPDLRTAVETLLTGLQDRWLVNTALEFHTAAAEKGAVGESTWHRMAVPAMQGRRHVFLRGVETTAVRDFHTSIAQDATLYNPVVESVFSGVAAAFETSPGDNGTLVELQLQLSHVPSPQRRPLEVQPGGDLYPAQYRIARFQHRGEMTSGRAMDLGDGPEVGTDDNALRSRQHVTLSTR